MHANLTVTVVCPKLMLSQVLTTSNEITQTCH